MTKFIGIGHKKQQGKGALANALSKYLSDFGYDVHCLGFADCVKQIAIQVYGLSWDQAWGGESSRSSETSVRTSWIGLAGNDRAATAREVLQYIGMKFREDDPDIWVKSALLRGRNTGADFALVSDLRFENELAAMDLTIRVHGRPVIEDDHVSEGALDSYEGWDFEVDNCGTLHDLDLSASWIAEKLIELG
jgi:hypothetical protein